jgi:hypothetical protein
MLSTLCLLTGVKVWEQFDPVIIYNTYNTIFCHPKQIDLLWAQDPHGMV